MFSGLRRLLRLRRTLPGLSPYAEQETVALDDRVLALRRAPGTPDELLCVTNVSAETVVLPSVSGYDVITATSTNRLSLGPWEFAWLRLPGPERPADCFIAPLTRPAARRTLIDGTPSSSRR